jgi:hypothetical protein
MTSTPSTGGHKHILNTREHPRVLLKVDDDLLPRWQFLLEGESQGTFRKIDDFREVDASEWDAVVTDNDLARRMHGYGSEPRDVRAVPENLYVFHTLLPTFSDDLDLDIFTDIKGKYRSIKQYSGVAGSQLRASGEYLEESLAELVKEFIPIAETREYQFGIRLYATEGSSGDPSIRSFMIGPSNLSLMGSYRRADGAGVWVVPSDVPDFVPWWEEALREWHKFDSEKFPGFPGWIERTEWRTHAEMRTITAIQSEQEGFAILASQHEEKIAGLQTELQEASAEDAPLKQLLNGTGIPLQDVVRDVLDDLGYIVREMDKEFPEREAREDFRITEPGNPGWLVMADATGVAKGAKGAKLQLLSTYVIQYLHDEGNAIKPKQWLFVNRLLDRDPVQRGGDIFRPDVLKPFEAAGGLAIDTPALFLLHRAFQEQRVSADELRDLLRDRTGELSTADAIEWLNSA